MSKIHLVIPDQHAHPEYDNDRAFWLGRLIADVNPDIVINIGDAADFPSLSSYEKKYRSYNTRNYEADLNAHLDFQEKLWYETKKRKKKLPFRVFIEGNHENRIEKALDLDPYLQGTIGFNDLQLESYYNEIVRYDGSTPGTIDLNGILYSHFFISGVMGKPVSGEHVAYSLLTKKFVSCTQGHTHTFDYAVRSKADGQKIHGLILPVYQDYASPWAGEINKLWDRGVIVKRNVEDGNYDMEFISINSLKKEYYKNV